MLCSLRRRDGDPLCTHAALGALSIKDLRRIVVDASHIDQKKRGIADMRETMLPLAKLLCRKDLKERYEDEDPNRHIDLLFY